MPRGPFPRPVKGRRLRNGPPPAINSEKSRRRTRKDAGRHASRGYAGLARAAARNGLGELAGKRADARLSFGEVVRFLILSEFEVCNVAI